MGSPRNWRNWLAQNSSLERRKQLYITLPLQAQQSSQNRLCRAARSGLATSAAAVGPRFAPDDRKIRHYNIPEPKDFA
jgi:hypothetical protein